MLFKQTSTPYGAITGTLLVRMVCPVRRPALECDTNYSLPFAVSLLLRPIALSVLLPTTCVTRAVQNIESFDDTPSLSQYLIQCDADLRFHWHFMAVGLLRYYSCVQV